MQGGTCAWLKQQSGRAQLSRHALPTKEGS